MRWLCGLVMVRPRCGAANASEIIENAAYKMSSKLAAEKGSFRL
jgi:hypothetical protein